MTLNEELKNYMSSYKNSVVHVRGCSGLQYTGILNDITDNVILLGNPITTTSPDGTILTKEQNLSELVISITTVESVVAEH